MKITGDKSLEILADGLIWSALRNENNLNLAYNKASLAREFNLYLERVGSLEICNNFLDYLKKEYKIPKIIVDEKRKEYIEIARRMIPLIDDGSVFILKDKK
jgi:hypothetical protein